MSAENGRRLPDDEPGDGALPEDGADLLAEPVDERRFLVALEHFRAEALDLGVLAFETRLLE